MSDAVHEPDNDPSCESQSVEVGVSLRGLSKRFGAVLALDALDLDLHSGEIHGILGQNGSGKSTLVKILSGYYAPEGGGSCQIGGQAMALPVRNPEQHGIAVIHQDLGLVESLSIMENMGIGLRYGQRSLSLCNWRKEARECSSLLAEFDLALNPNDRIADISPSERAIVALARAVRTLRKQARVHAFLLDEPTAYMPASESVKILAVMRSVAAMGATVIFVSHRLDEVVEVTDRVTVLRDGRKVGTVTTSSGVRDRLLDMMLGDAANALTRANPTRRGTSQEGLALRVEGLCGDTVHDVSFEAARGEILGLTGLTGMGQEEVPYLIAGASRPRAGKVITSTGRAVAQSPAKSFRDGVVLVPSDRRRDGIWLAATATENITLPNLRRYFKGWLRRGREVQRAKSLMTEFHVRPADADRVLSQFSGGNQQKILLAKWLQEQPAVLLLAEPTQGVDIGARHEIHELLRDLAEKGAAVLVSSSDQEELALLCSRVLVFRDGGSEAVLAGREVTQENIVAACQGEQRPSA